MMDPPHRISDKETLHNIIEGIAPEKLSHRTHSQNLEKLVNSITPILSRNKSLLSLIIQILKESKQASYKRDTLIQLLDALVFSKDVDLFKQTFRETQSSNNKWRGFATALSSIPEVVANCGALNKYPQFIPQKFHSNLLSRLCSSIETDDLISTSLAQKKFYFQLLYRVSLINDGQLVWNLFTEKYINICDENIKCFVSSLFTLPLQSNSQLSLDVFPERLYWPIFYNLQPTEYSGQRIKSLIGSYIVENDLLKYTICNKLIHQLAPKLDRRRQYTILFNLFSYLNLIDGSTSTQPCQSDLIFQMLLDLTRTWSERHKILLRPPEHSRFITCAIVIAFRFVVGNSEKNLASVPSVVMKEIQSKLMLGIQVYLDRASEEQRNLAITLGELLFPKINKLMIGNDFHEQSAKKPSQGENSNENELNFGVKLSDDCLEIKKLFSESMDSLFRQHEDELDKKDLTQAKPGSSILPAANISESTVGISKFDKSVQSCDSNGTKPSGLSQNVSSCKATKSNLTISPKKLVELINSDRDEDDDDDDLEVYCRENDNDYSNSDDDLLDTVHDKAMICSDDIASAPMYLRDCINGLAESDKPRYIQLCLIKAGELIVELTEAHKQSNVSAQEQNGGKFLEINHRPGSSVVSSSDFLLLSSSKQDLFKSKESSSNASPNQQKQLAGFNKSSSHDYDKSYYSRFQKRYENDAIRDVAIELARLLLFLDNQYNIENFQALRMRALINLATAAPDLVVNYLLDEFNEGTNLNIRHHLDILQVLVSSAQQLSGSLFFEEPVLADILALDSKSNKDHIGQLNKGKTATSKMMICNAKVGRGLKQNFMQAATSATTIQQADYNFPHTIGVSSSIRHSNTKLTNDPMQCSSNHLNGRPNGEENKLIKFAQLYFYGIVHRLKVDLIGRVSPNSILLASERQCRSPAPSPITQSSQELNFKKHQFEIDWRQANANANDDNDNYYGYDGGDDLGGSYLLCRIFISLSLILKCLSQQPVMCKLSRDLLDHLVAYRDHQDLGVRKSMFACLVVISECTPRVYYEQHLHHLVAILSKSLSIRMLSCA